MLFNKQLDANEHEPLYSRLLNAGYPLRDVLHQGTNLQVYKTPLTEPIIKDWCGKTGHSTYGKDYSVCIHPINHRAMYNIPGQYPEELTQMTLMSRFDRLAQELEPDECYAIEDEHFITRRTPLSENIIGEWAADLGITSDNIVLTFPEHIPEGAIIVHLNDGDQSPIGPITKSEIYEDDNDYFVVRTVKHKNGIRNVWDRITGRGNTIAFVESLSQDPNVIVSSIKIFDECTAEPVFEDEDDDYELSDEDNEPGIIRGLFPED